MAVTTMSRVVTVAALAIAAPACWQDRSPTGEPEEERGGAPQAERARPGDTLADPQASAQVLAQASEPSIAASPGAVRHVEQIRAAFRVARAAPHPAAPHADTTPAAIAGQSSVTPVIADSFAAGYARTPDGLRAVSADPPEVELVLPAAADGARRLEHAGVAISARLRGTALAPAEPAGGYLLYRDALGAGVSLVAQPRADGVEDFLHFPQRPAAERLIYDVTLDAGVGGLRLVANTLEILDGAGVPRLRVNPAYAIGADGAVVDVTLSVDGCAVDTSPAVPSKVRVAPGARSCAVELAWKGLRYPALVDPAWVTTGAMAFARVFPASSLVIDNRHVLVTGGYDLVSGALASAEIYDLATGVWTVTGSMTDRRYLHQQVLLGTGKVLVTGGLDTSAPYVAASQEYDPSSGTWVHRAVMASARSDFPLVMLSGVPIALGGWSGPGPLAASEKYDVATHTWSAFPSLSIPRAGAAAQVHGAAFVVSGGFNFASGYLDSSELYSTAAGVFWPGATMTSRRAYHLANPVVGNPKVLVTGGSNGGVALKTAEAYFGSFVFPQPGSWSAVANMAIERMRHQTLNLAPHRVLACGGVGLGGAPTRSCETFDSLTFGWSADCDLVTARNSFTMLLLPAAGRALAAGGHVLASAELSCHHDRCVAGPALPAATSACVSSICAADPFCCTTSWDAACIAQVRTVCGSLVCPEAAGSCSHSLCATGPALVSACDAGRANCGALVCAADPFCCTTSWDSVCVGKVASVCGKTCN